VLVVVVAGLLAAIFVPFSSASKQIQVVPGSSASVDLTIPEAAWVTVHFDHHGTMAMMYWMEGSCGMMFNHRGMMQGDAYSFWTGGGTFHCWAECDGAGAGPSTVWVNATWGLL